MSIRRRQVYHKDSVVDAIYNGGGDDLEASFASPWLSALKTTEVLHIGPVEHKKPPLLLNLLVT